MLQWSHFPVRGRVAPASRDHVLDVARAPVIGANRWFSCIRFRPTALDTRCGHAAGANRRDPAHAPQGPPKAANVLLSTASQSSRSGTPVTSAMVLIVSGTR